MLILEVELHVVKYYKISRFRRKIRLGFKVKNYLEIETKFVTKFLPRGKSEKVQNELFSLKDHQDWILRYRNFPSGSYNSATPNCVPLEE